MRSLLPFVFVALSGVAVLGGANLTPLYGVQTENQAHFNAAVGAGSFSCMDGSQAGLPLSYINDNYCDCADGSDEPGTSACSFEVKFPDKWRFQCSTPIGDRFKSLFHSRINDGICDCCDGSDEFDGRASCSNNCAEAAEKEEREAREREERRQAGLTAKTAMIAQGEKKRTEITEELARIESELSGFEAELAPLTIVKNEEEQKEREEREAIKTKSLAEKAVWEAEQAERKAAAEKADAERRAAAEANPDVERTEDQESVRYVCSKWRQTKECKGDGDRDVNADKDCGTLIESGWSGYCECFDAVQGMEVKHPKDCGHGQLTCDYVCAHQGEEGTGKDELPEGSGSEDQPEEPKFDLDEGHNHHRPEANAARDKWNAVDNRKQEVVRRKEDLTKDKEQAYFDYPAFLSMKGECFERDDGSYTYRMCLFDSVHQRSRGAGGTGGTHMGNFNGFGEQTYGSWGAKHDVSKMKFEHGTQCYGGPQRSVAVSVICGPESKLLSVDEPSMCTYTMVFQTPAVCE